MFFSRFIKVNRGIEGWAKALVLAVAMFGFGGLVQAASLEISPASGTYSAGQTFSTTVRLNPAGATGGVNAAEATIKFDPAVLSVVSIINGPAFSMWPNDPAFSNSAGTVTFSGGNPKALSAASNVITINWRAVKDGSSDISVTKGLITANDGKGTDVYQASAPAKFTITTAATPTPTIPTTPTTPTEGGNSGDEAIIFGDKPRAPEVGSQAFLDPNLWYKTKDGLFTWTTPFDVNAVAIEIAATDDNEPSKNKNAIIEPPVDEFRLTPDLLVDGVQYFSIQFKNQVGWGATLNRKLQIDTTAPKPFKIVVNAGPTPDSFPTLTFAAEDEASGIDYYMLMISDQEPKKVTPEEAKLGFLLKDLENGTYTVKVTAYDKAGNTTESTEALLITANWTKQVVEEQTGSFWDFVTPINMLVLFLVVLIILQFVFIWYERKRLKEREDKLRRETREIQDQMEKIFSALRDEIYDQVNMITKRKRLSKGEKEAVEGLNQALEVSETLIEKEINDVKSILK